MKINRNKICDQQKGEGKLNGLYMGYDLLNDQNTRPTLIY